MKDRVVFFVFFSQATFFSFFFEGNFFPKGQFEMKAKICIFLHQKQQNIQC